MGRWAQRRLGNGGGGSGPAPILIISAEVTNAGTGLVVVTFSDEVVETDFNSTDFEVEPSAVGASAIGQNGTNGLDVIFGFDISGQTDITYTGTAPNVSSPQTVALTF